MKRTLKLFNRSLALILALLLVLGMVPLNMFAESTKTRYIDTSGHWATESIERWSDYGVITGYNNAFRPNDPITRAELAAVLNKAIGYTATGVNPFTDVDSGKWYYDAVLKLAKAGIMLGYDSKARPESAITREEAVTLISRAFDISLDTSAKPFSDLANVSPWAAGYVSGMHAAGYITGKPGNVFDPMSDITRAEVVTILDNIVMAFYNTAGEYTGDVSGNAVIRTSGVTLKNTEISRNLYLAEGIGDGVAVLDNTVVAGTVYIRGGGGHSVTAAGGSYGDIIIKSVNQTRLNLGQDTKVTHVYMYSASSVARGGVNISYDDAKTVTLGGSFDKVMLNADGTMTISADGIIYEILPSDGMIDTVKLTDGSIVKEMVVNAPLHIAGTGQINKLGIHADGVVLDKGVKVNSNSSSGGNDTVKVSYETFGEPKIEPSIVAKGSTLSALPQPSRPGDVFTGWHTDIDLSEPFDASQPLTKDITLYADWTKRDNNYREYSQPDKFIDDCSPRYEITLSSTAVQLTVSNLADYVLLEGTGQIPELSVSSPEDDHYVIMPQTDYEAGCLYTFSLKDSSITFIVEDVVDPELRSLTIRPYKEETKEIVFNDNIIDVDWDDVDSYTIDDETGIGSIQIPAFKYSGVKETFLLNSVNPEARTTIRITDSMYSLGEDNYHETEYLNITDLEEKDGILLLWTEGSQLVDVFKDLDIYLNNIEIDLDDYMTSLDLQTLSKQAAESPAARKMGELLNASLAESPTIQRLLAEPNSFETAYLTSKADYGFVTPSQENEKQLVPGLFNTFLELKGVKATTGETDNANFYNKRGYFVTVEFGYSGTIKDKVQVDATFKVTEYLSLYADLRAIYNGDWKRPKTWDDLEVTFLTNVFSQTDITVDVIAKSVSKDPEYAYEIDVSEELTKLMNGDEEAGVGASAMLKKVLADQGDYIDIISLPIVETSIEIIPEAPVIEVEFELDFVIKASFAAGVHTDMTFLGARVLGFYYNLDNGNTINYNLPFENYDNQYYIDLWAAGYFGIKTGLKGEVSIGVIGLKNIFDAGMSLELGAYADMWGLIHLQHYRHLYPHYKGTDVQGGLYFEVGIYLEMEMFVRSKTFGVKAGWKFLDSKWPLFTFGDRYLLIKFGNNNARILMRGDLSLTGGAGLFDAEFIDLKTGNIVKGGTYASPKNFNIVVPSPYFEVDRTDEKIKIRTDKMGDLSINPYVAKGTKTLSSSATVYYNGSALAFGTHTVVPYGYEYLTYSQKGLTLIWADPNLDISNISDLKSYKATYYLNMNGKKTLLDQRDLLVGEVPGGPVLAKMGNFKYLTWSDIIGYGENCVIKDVSPDFYSAITKDTEYIITAEKLQRLEAIATHHDGKWRFDVYAVNCGELPILPEGYDANFGGWISPVNWYIETGYPAITATAFDKLQPAGIKYQLGQTEDGRSMISYRPDLVYVSGYPTDTPLYSYNNPNPEDYSGHGIFNNYLAYAYVHKWQRPPKYFGPAQDVFGSRWTDAYDFRVGDRFGNFGEDINWTRFYEYLYVAEYSKKEYSFAFNAGKGEFAPYMKDYLDDYGLYSGTHLIGTVTYTLPADSVVPPTDSKNSYILTDWKDKDGEIYKPGEKYEFKKDMSFTAQYTAVPDVYTITIYPVGEAFPDGYKKKTFTGGCDKETNIDTDISFDIFDDWAVSAGEGYEYAFDGWYWNNNDKLGSWPATFGTFGKDARDSIIVAKIKRVPQQYTITFNANGGTFSGDETTYTKTYPYGAIIDPADIPVPTRAEDEYFTYTFNGWGFYGTMEPVTKNDTYYASWSKTLKDTPLPSGIFISDGVTTEDINCVNLDDGYTPISGYSYELVEELLYDPDLGIVVTYNLPTLTITGSALTVSGEVSRTINKPEDTVRIVIEENVTDITFKDLSLTGLYEYGNVIYTGHGSPLKITIAGDCSLEKPNDGESGAHRSAISSYRNILLQGADENAKLTITTVKADGITVYGDITFEGLTLMMNVSGIIDENDVYGDDTLIVPIMAKAFGGESNSNIQITDAKATIRSPGSTIGGNLIMEGNTDLKYVSADTNPALVIKGSLIFEDFTGCFHVYFADSEVAKPPVVAYKGIDFFVAGSAAQPSDYGANVSLCKGIFIDGYYYDDDYYTFVDDGGNPLYIVTVKPAVAP